MKKNIQQKKPNPYESYGLMSVCNFSRKISFVFVGEEEEKIKDRKKVINLIDGVIRKEKNNMKINEKENK